MPGKRRMPISESANSDGCARWKKKMRASNDWWRISRLTNTCCRRPCEKQSTARTPLGTGRLVAGYLPGQWPAGLPIGLLQSRGLVSTESRHGSIWSPALHARSGPCPSAMWVSVELGVVETRRLARESQTGAATVSTRWPTAADASATPEAYRVASGSSSGPGGPD